MLTYLLIKRKYAQASGGSDRPQFEVTDSVDEYDAIRTLSLKELISKKGVLETYGYQIVQARSLFGSTSTTVSKINNDVQIPEDTIKRLLNRSCTSQSRSLIKVCLRDGKWVPLYMSECVAEALFKEKSITFDSDSRLAVNIFVQDFLNLYASTTIQELWDSLRTLYVHNGDVIWDKVDAEKDFTPLGQEYIDMIDYIYSVSVRLTKTRIKKILKGDTGLTDTSAKVTPPFRLYADYVE